MNKLMTVADELKLIIKKLQTDSGYPYGMESNTSSACAFAYGLAIGTLEMKLKDWEQRLAGGSDGR